MYKIAIIVAFIITGMIMTWAFYHVNHKKVPVIEDNSYFNKIEKPIIKKKKPKKENKKWQGFGNTPGDFSLDQ